MGKYLFKKRDKIRALEIENWGLRQQLERQNFSFQLTVPMLTTKNGQEEIRFSGSPEAIESFQKYMERGDKKFDYKKRPTKTIKQKGSTK